MQHVQWCQAGVAPICTTKLPHTLTYPQVQRRTSALSLLGRSTPNLPRLLLVYVMFLLVYMIIRNLTKVLLGMIEVRLGTIKNASSFVLLVNQSLALSFYLAYNLIFFFYISRTHKTTTCHLSIWFVRSFQCYRKVSTPNSRNKARSGGE